MAYFQVLLGFQHVNNALVRRSFNVQNPDTAYQARITRLTSTRSKEAGLIYNHFVSIYGGDFRVEFFHVRVFPEKPTCQNERPPTSFSKDSIPPQQIAAASESSEDVY